MKAFLSFGKSLPFLFIVTFCGNEYQTFNFPHSSSLAQSNLILHALIFIPTKSTKDIKTSFTLFEEEFKKISTVYKENIRSLLFLLQNPSPHEAVHNLSATKSLYSEVNPYSHQGWNLLYKLRWERTQIPCIIFLNKLGGFIQIFYIQSGEIKKISDFIQNYIARSVS